MRTAKPKNKKSMVCLNTEESKQLRFASRKSDTTMSSFVREAIRKEAAGLLGRIDRQVTALEEDEGPRAA
jgi:hypothetical protein